MGGLLHDRSWPIVRVWHSAHKAAIVPMTVVRGPALLRLTVAKHAHCGKVPTTARRLPTVAHILLGGAQTFRTLANTLPYVA